MKNKKILRSVNKFVVSIVLFVLLFGTALTYFSYINYSEFTSYQRGIATQSVKGTANNIAISMQSLKVSLKIFIDAHKKQLADLGTDEKFSVLDKKLSARFDDYYSYTVADQSGVLLYDDFEERVGPVCRKDIIKYANSKHGVHTYIHPGPGRYHFDVMLNWKSNQKKNMVFFASFGTKRISSLLRNAQAPGHQLILLRNNPANLVEISAHGNRSDYTSLIRITKKQKANILYKQAIANTRWILVDIATRDLPAKRIRFLIVRDSMIFLVVLLIAGVMLRRVLKEDRQRRVAEKALKYSNVLLEDRVAERTYEVSQSNMKLRLEVDNSRKLSRAVEQADDLIIITDSIGKVEYVNPAFERNTGFALAEVSGESLSKIQSGEQDNEFYESMWERLNKGEVFRSVFVNRRKDGTIYHEEKTITPIRDREKKITHFVSTGKDITDRIVSEKRMQHLAYHDLLTGLPNRMMFTERLESALYHSDEKNILAVLFIDLDRFKTINDSLGHAMGDHLLRIIAGRLSNTLTDSDTVSRLGGDEFALIVTNAKDINGLLDTTRQILSNIASPVMVGDYELYTTASIGITIIPFTEEDSGTLLKQADTAMYRAKDNGGNRFELFSFEMGQAASRRLEIENNLHGALDRDEFSLHYQPRICLTTGEITGAEALLRWNSPVHGNVSPVEFIPLLEETGQIIEVGKWVLKRACEDFASLSNPIRLAVNLSPRQFIDNRLEQDILDILADTQFSAELLDVEITESLLVQDRVRVNQILQTLHDNGIKISIDDFGTGYSSLSYLKDYPIDCLKIDRSFVIDLPADMSNAKLISAIISMAHGLNMTVVTEGIETEEQLAIVKEQQSDEAQGYLFSRPLPLSDFKEWLGIDEAIMKNKLSNSR